MTSTESSSAEVQRQAETERAELANTLDKLRENLRPANVLDEVIASARVSSKDVTDKIWSTARSNPIPAVLIGLGAAMLVGVGQRVKSKKASQDHDWSDEGRFPVQSARVSSRKVQSYRTTSEVASSTTSTFSRISEGADALKERAGRQLSFYGSSAQAGLNALSKDNAMNQYSRSRDQLASTISNLLEEQPLILAALGIAVGAAVGAAIPTTETEGRLMGDASGSVKRNAQQIAQDQLEQIKAKAGETLGDLKQTAADHGVSSENLSGLLSDVGGTIRDAAHDTANKASSELEQNRG